MARLSKHPSLFPGLREKALSCSELNTMLTVSFSYMAVILLIYVLSKPASLTIFIMNGC